jgi:hypothetical protein
MHETRMGQQVAQFLDCYMMMMMTLHYIKFLLLTKMTIGIKILQINLFKPVARGPHAALERIIVLFIIIVHCMCHM